MELDDHENSAATIIDLAVRSNAQVSAQIVDCPNGQRLENHKQDEFMRIAHDIEANTSVEMVLGNPA